MRFFIRSWNEANKEELVSAISWVGRLEEISKGTRVFIKPNFTYPFFKKGVTTPPDLIRTIVEILVDRGADITIGEGGASLDVFDLYDSFEDHGLYDLKEKYGVKLVHLRDVPNKFVNVGKKKACKSVPIPELLLEKTDLLINLPVPKVHAMTLVSLATKNLWGCIGARKRFIFHPCINEILCFLVKKFPPQLIVCDGRYVLTDNGPMFGRMEQADFLAVSDSPGAFDVAMCRLMGFNPENVRHIRFLIERGVAPASWSQINCNDDPLKFRPFKFTLRRTLQNYIALAGFNSSFLTWLGYDSFVSDLLHKILYAIKPNPLEKELKEWKGKNLSTGKMD